MDDVKQAGRARSVDSVADEIRRLHDLCEVKRIENEEPRPPWTRWFNVFWASGVMLVVLTLLTLVTKLPPHTAGILALILVPFAGVGLVHMLISTVIEIVFMARSIWEEKKPFSRMDSKLLPDLIREEIDLSHIDPAVVDHVIASQETNAAILQTNLNWMKGCALGGVAGIVAIVYQGSALRSMLENWTNPIVSLIGQGILLMGFFMMFAIYVVFWRRVVLCENRARFLKFIRDRRSFLLSIDAKVTS